MASTGMLLLLLWQWLPRVAAQAYTTTCPPLDCSIGLSNWEMGWSDDKKAYCCKLEGVGCPEVAAATTTLPTYPDCSFSYESDQASWSESKKEWCCSSLGVACPETTTTTTSCSFDCQVGLSNWRAGWAEPKIEWCCKHEGLACEPTTATVTTTPTPTETTTTPTTTATATRTTTATQTATATQTTATQTATATATRTTTTATATASSTTTTTTACHFDCQVGLNNWQMGWAQTKIDWCCKHRGVACTTTTSTATTTPEPFDCEVGQADLLTGWAQAKMDWCCEHHGVACPTTTATVTTTTTPVPTTTTTTRHFDCKVGLDNWRAGWARPKKQWCCKHEGLGCEEVMTCHLACFGKGARPLPLPGAVGSGGGAMLTDVSLEQCSSACASAPGCDGVMYTNKTKGSPFKSMCYGKKDIHTHRCQPGGHTYLTQVFGDSRPWGKCAVFGDPHMLSFDRVYGPPVTNTDPGEYHLVKSSQLSIQGRFGYTQRFKTASSTVGIAVGGPMIKGHTLVVAYVGPETGYKGFKVFWDGERILDSYPSTFTSDDEVLTATHGAMDPDKYHREGRHTIGGVSGNLPSYLFRFSPDLTVYILIGPDNCNAIIETRKLPVKQDGYCGNFNCDTEDDDLEALQRRGIADPMSPEESLFKYGEPAPAWVMRKVSGPSLKDCDPAVRAKAIRTCSKLPEGDRQACVFDACAADAATAAAEDVEILRAPDAGAAGMTPSSDKACNVTCKYKGISATCTDRVSWLTAHTYYGHDEACEEAHRLVIRQCASCSRCSVEASGCKRHAPKLDFVRKPGLAVFRKFSTRQPRQPESRVGSGTMGGLLQAAAAGAALAAAVLAVLLRAWRRAPQEGHLLLAQSEEVSAFVE